MKRILFSLFVLVLALMPVFSASAQDLNVQEKVSDDDVYVETYQLTKEEIKKFTKGDKVVIDPQLLKNAKKHINKGLIEIPLNPNKETLEAKKVAELAGNTFSLENVNYSVNFVDQLGNPIKVKDYKKLIEKKNLASAKDKKYSVKFAENDIAVYPYMSSYISEYAEYNSTTNQKRHWLYSKHAFFDGNYMGAVTVKDYNTSYDVAALAWSIGGTTYSEPSRGATANYKSLYDSSRTLTFDKNSLTKHTQSDTNSNAWKVYENYVTVDDYYYITSMEVYNYTGWYDVNKYFQDGSITAEYAHTYDTTTLSFSVGVSTGGAVSIGWSPSSETVVDIGKVYTTFSTK